MREQIRRVVWHILDRLIGFRQPVHQKPMTLDEVTEWFVEHQTRVPADSRKVLSRQVENDHVQLDLLFVDSDNEPVRLGRRGYAAKSGLYSSLDPDVETLFGDHDIVVFQ